VFKSRNVRAFERDLSAIEVDIDHEDPGVHLAAAREAAGSIDRLISASLNATI
jgi:hypothetical protein